MYMSHIHEKVTFPGSSGTLSGNLQIPEGTPKGGVLLSHCFTCSKSLKVTRRLATGIEAGGYAVLRYDFTGLGESEVSKEGPRIVRLARSVTG
jgi:putative redox protein